MSRTVLSLALVSSVLLTGASVAQTTSNDDAADFLNALEMSLSSAAVSNDPIARASIIDFAVAARPDLEPSIRAIAERKGIALVSANEIAEAAGSTEAQSPSVEAPTDARTGFIHGWTGEFLFDFELERGNSEEAEFDASIDTTKTSGVWEYQFQVDYEYTEVNEVRAEDEILARFDVRRSLTDRLALTGFASGESDEFDGYEYRYLVGAGLAYRIFDRDNLFWRVSGGPAYQVARTTVADEIERDFALAGETRIRWEPIDRLTLGADATTLLTNRSRLLAEVFAEAQLWRRFGIRASQEFDAELKPPLGAESFNPTTAISLVYKIGDLNALDQSFQYGTLTD